MPVTTRIQKYISCTKAGRISDADWGGLYNNVDASIIGHCAYRGQTRSFSLDFMLYDMHCISEWPWGVEKD